MNVFFDSARLAVIGEKVERGRRLEPAEGLWLFDPQVPLGAVGELADRARRRRYGDRAFYNVNRHVNPTNVCLNRCRFCAFRADPDDERAYVLEDEEILRLGHEAAAQGCTELHLVGGLHPDKPYRWYVDIVRRLHEALPAIHLKAWTAVEIEYFTRIASRPIEAILRELREAGLGSLPGGGAEIFHPDVRRQICQHKADASTWLQVHRTAHRLGLRSTATMLFGHVEAAEHRIDHLVRLRSLQDETGGFQAFVPLPFQSSNTAFADLPSCTAEQALRTIAVSRLMLDNFDHIKAYWVMLGVGVAQTALAFGADDLDGTVGQEQIGHLAGARSPQTLSVEAIHRLIREAGDEPIERDSLYRRVRRDSAGNYLDAVELPAADEAFDSKSG